MRPSRTGVVLAGGRSRRMGAPKALLDLHGLPLIAHVARALRPACDELLLSVAAKSEAPPAFVEALRRAVLASGWPSLTVEHDSPHARDRGPVGGLATVLPRARGEIAFVAACDTPFLAPALVREILRRAEEPDAPDVVLPVWDGRDQPLLAAYRVRTMAPHFATRLRAGGGRPTDGLEPYSVVRIPDEELRRVDPSGASFVNLNDPEEYRAAVARRPAGHRCS